MKYLLVILSSLLLLACASVKKQEIIKVEDLPKQSKEDRCKELKARVANLEVVMVQTTADTWFSSFVSGGFTREDMQRGLSSMQDPKLRQYIEQKYTPLITIAESEVLGSSECL